MNIYIIKYLGEKETRLSTKAFCNITDAKLEAMHLNNIAHKCNKHYKSEIIKLQLCNDN